MKTIEHQVYSELSRLDYVKMLELAEGVARLHAEYPSVFAQYEHGDVLNMIRLAYIQGYAAGVVVGNRI